MFLVFIVVTWLAVVALVVGLDIGTVYLADRQIEKIRNEKPSPVIGTLPSIPKEKNSVGSNLQTIELGLIRIEKRVPRTHGMHRRTRPS